MDLYPLETINMEKLLNASLTPSMYGFKIIGEFQEEECNNLELLDDEFQECHNLELDDSDKINRSVYHNQEIDSELSKSSSSK